MLVDANGNPIDTPDEPTPTPPPAPPTWVPSEEFKGFQAQVTQTLQAIQTNINALASAYGQGRPQSPSTPAAMSDEEIETAFNEGKGAQVVKRLLTEERERIRREEIGPLRELGLSAIANLTESIARGKMSPHLYTRYKGEIDQYIQSLSPEAKLNPQAHEIAYNAVVGRHVNEITSEAVQAAMRKKADEPPAPPPGSTTGRTQDQNSRVPTVEDYAGRDGAAALAGIGKDGDAFARRLGYKDWTAYMAKAKELGYV